MSEIAVTLFRLSVCVVAVAAKGNQGEIVQQQIETMGLHQWLSLVSAWLVERAYSEIAALRDLSAAVFRPRTAKDVRFAVLNRAHDIEFNLLNRYLIVPTSPQFIFNHDGKRVPHKDTAKSSQPRTS